MVLNGFFFFLDKKKKIKAEIITQSLIIDILKVTIVNHYGVLIQNYTFAHAENRSIKADLFNWNTHKYTWMPKLSRVL